MSIAAGTADAALAYLARGWAVVPVPTGSKAPKIPGWQHLRIASADVGRYFAADANIGLLNGEPSGGLADGDLDSGEARRAAEAFLPETDCVFGRPGKPASHRLYIADPPLTGTKKYIDPTRSGPDGTLVELRWTGTQTIAPPSSHSGEQIAWERDGEPSRVDGRLLLAACGKLAACALLVRSWPAPASHQRHDTALALAGVLLRAGWLPDDATDFIRVVATLAGDEETDDRVAAVETTLRRIHQNGAATGTPHLAQLLGDPTVRAVRDWLGIQDAPKSRIIFGEDGTPDEAPSLTDMGNARRFIERHGDDARYCYPWGSWLVWAGSRWRSDDTGRVEAFAQDTAEAIRAEAEGVPDEDAARALLKWAKASQAASRLGAMLDVAKATRPVLPAALDADPWLLNCTNGTVDLRTGELLPHDRAQLLTKLAPAAYAAAAPCPRWEAFLARIMGGNDEIIAFVRRAVGYSLSGSIREQAMFFCYGTGSNGKSTLLNTVLALLGDYAMSAPADLLLTHRQERHPTELADLFGRRFVAAIEAGEGRRLDEPLVKMLTGGEQVRARRMREDFWEFPPSHKLWLAANHKPIVRDATASIWRRLLLIPFEVQIPEGDRDTDLALRLREELPGILAWAVRGCLDWQRTGLRPPVIVRDATEGYRVEMDVIGRFLEECCIQREGLRVRARALYEAFGTWCTATGERAGTETSFGRRMVDRGLPRQRKENGVVYAGIGLVGAEEQTAM